MEFEYELTEPEWGAFDQVVLDRTAVAFKAAVGAWKVRVAYGLAGIPIGIAVWTFMDLYRENPQLWTDLGTIVGSLVVAGTLMAGGRVYRRQLFEKKFDFRDRWLGVQHLVADEVGVTLTSPGTSSHLSWTLVREVVEDPATLYVFYSLSHALVFPKRLFRSTDELDQVRRWASGGGKLTQ